MPKLVAAANQNADVKVNAFAVALPVCRFCSEVDNLILPQRWALHIAWRKSSYHLRHSPCPLRYAV
jgi:hypothetical protein